MDGACTAQAHPASELRPRELDYVVEIPQQRHLLIAIELLAFPVNLQLDQIALSLGTAYT